MSPHKFCQVPCVQSFVNSIFRQVYPSMSKLTFYAICACCRFLILELFGMIYSDMCITQFIKFRVCFPAVTMNNTSRLNPFLKNSTQVFLNKI